MVQFLTSLPTNIVVIVSALINLVAAISAVACTQLLQHKLTRRREREQHLSTIYQDILSNLKTAIDYLSDWDVYPENIGRAADYLGNAMTILDTNRGHPTPAGASLTMRFFNGA
jgi:hypothetical protein